MGDSTASEKGASRLQKVLASLFLVCIFAAGLVTLWNCRLDFAEAVRSGDFEKGKKAVETAIQDNFAWHNQWINLNGGFQRVLGTTIVRGASGDVYKLSNGQIMYNLDARNMEPYAKKVVKFQDELAEAGIPFMYVQYPFKIQDDSVMPIGTHDSGNANAASLTALLREKGVDVLDVRELVENENFDWPSLFFRTDHHWLPSTGLWASGVLMRHIADEYGLDVDMSCYDMDSYDVTMYEDWLLGSMGRRTGAWYDGVDDFYLLNPKFETELNFWGKRDGGIIRRSGSFWDSVYAFENLAEKATFDKSTYETYTGGQYKTMRFTNLKADNDFKILMIRDSFSSVTVPFMALNTAEITTMDLRKYKKSALKYAKKYQPDLVIVAYNPSQFSKNQFNFTS